MLSDFLDDHAALVAAALVVAVLGSLGLAALLARMGPRGRLVAAVLAAASLLPVLAITVGFADDGPREIVCRMPFSLGAMRDAALEAVANAVMLVPTVVFAVAAIRRPVLVAAAASAISAGIELAQGVVPAIGRTCDANDWLLNSLGAVVAAALAWGVVTIARPRSRPRDPRDDVDPAERQLASAGR